MSSTLEIVIQGARKGQLPAISRLLQETWRQLASTPRELEARFRSFPEAFMLAWAHTELAGFCAASRIEAEVAPELVDETFPSTHHPTGRVFVIHSLTVSPVFRRRKVGERLVHAQLELARAARCRTAQAVANEMSLGLFRYMGFKERLPLDHLYQGFERLMPRPVFVEKRLAAKKPSGC